MNSSLVWYSEFHVLVATRQSSAKYALQTESYSMTVSYNTTAASALSPTWKENICFSVFILIIVPFFFLQQDTSPVGNDFQFSIQT